jgi:hypothetical protein
MAAKDGCNRWGLAALGQESVQMRSLHKVVAWGGAVNASSGSRSTATWTVPRHGTITSLLYFKLFRLQVSNSAV